MLNVLTGVVLLIAVITYAAPKTRGIALFALGFLMWVNPGVFAGLLMLIGISSPLGPPYRMSPSMLDGAELELGARRMRPRRGCVGGEGSPRSVIVVHFRSVVAKWQHGHPCMAGESAN